MWAASAAGRASGGRGAQERPAAARAADSPPAAGRVGGVRADDGTHIGCQASNVVFEDGNLTRKEATIIIQSVRALDAIKRLRLYGKFTHHPNLLRRASQIGVAATNSFLGGPETDRR